MGVLHRRPQMLCVPHAIDRIPEGERTLLDVVVID
jgi:hypothetical protein